MNNRTITAALAFVVGLAMVVWGFYYATLAPVDCHGKVIHSGESCTLKKTVESYEDKLKIQHWMGWALLLVGSAAVIGAVVLAIRASLRRPAPPQGYPTTHGPGSYPPPGAPPSYPPPPGGQPYYPPPRYPPPPAPPPGPQWPQR